MMEYKMNVSKMQPSYTQIYSDQKKLTVFIHNLPQTTFNMHLPISIGEIVLEFYNIFEICFDENAEYNVSDEFSDKSICNLLISFDLHFDFRRTRSFLCEYCQDKKRLIESKDEQDYDM
jgi:hypothetical protein